MSARAAGPSGRVFGFHAHDLRAGVLAEGEVDECADQLGQLHQQARDQAAPLLVLDLLTRVLPDTAWLHSVQLEGAKLTVSGDADDTAALVQRLGAQPGVHGVRLPSPVTRSPGAAKEAFVIEMELDPARYGLVRGGVAQ